MSKIDPDEAMLAFLEAKRDDVPEEELEQKYRIAVEAIEGRIAELQKQSKRSKFAGLVMVIAGGSMMLPTGAKIFNIPWWWQIPPMIVIGYGAYQLGRWIGNRTLKTRLGPTIYSLAMEAEREETEATAKSGEFSVKPR